MDSKDYTNKELAQDYFTITVKLSRNLTIYNDVKRKIAESDIDLADFYHDHGKSLEQLELKGVGKKTRGILELILDKGKDGAKRIIDERRIEALQKSAFSGIPTKPQRPRRDGYLPPSCEDIVNVYEEDER